MIKFSCNNCGHRLGVKDELAGKKGKCPECSNIILVPDKTLFVSFQCENCGRNISALPTQSGKKGKCPNCNHTLVVPQLHGLILLDATAEYKLEDQPASPPAPAQQEFENQENDDEFKEEVESDKQQKLPWLVDAFLYPISASGMVNLAVFVLLPRVIAFLVGVLAAFLSPFLQFGTSYIILFLTIPFYVVFACYVCYYVAHCVIDSAKGNRRASDLPIADTFDVGDLISQTIILVGCVAICYWPVAVYYVLTQQTDARFWLLSAAGTFFLPMSFLAGVMFDSFDALNPLRVVQSISRTFLSYCGLVLFFYAISGLFVVALPKIPMWVFVRRSIQIYMAFVLAHRLGWFYWWHKDKLGWGL